MLPRDEQVTSTHALFSPLIFYHFLQVAVNLRSEKVFWVRATQIFSISVTHWRILWKLFFFWLLVLDRLDLYYVTNYLHCFNLVIKSLGLLVSLNIIIGTVVQTTLQSYRWNTCRTITKSAYFTQCSHFLFYASTSDQRLATISKK